MDDESLRELLQGDDGVDRRSANWSRALSVVAALLIGFGLFWILIRENPTGTDLAVATVPTSAPATTTSTFPPLVAFEPDSPVLYYPRVLPEGMEMCSAQLGLPVIGDEMCDPEDEFRWVKVAVLMTGPPGGTGLDGWPGITVLRESPPEVGVAVGEGGYRLWSEGVPLDQLIEIAASIPIASPEVFDVADESNIATLDEATLAEMLGQQQSQVDFRGGPGGDWEVYAPGLNLYTTPRFDEASSSIREIGMGLAHAQLVSPDHALVVGIQANALGAEALWIQRDRYWSLSSERTLEQLIDLVLSMEQAIEQLP